MEYFAALKARFPRLTFAQDFDFSRHTTIGCGGRAALCACPRDTEEAAELLRFLLREEIPHCFLGAGANVLPPDGFYEGVVVRFSAMNFLLPNGIFIRAGAGATGGALCRAARSNALSGFEPFTGIPMTVGGGVVMNAGVAAGHFSDVVEEVVGIERGRIRKFSLKDCVYSEKSSIFQSGIAVCEVLLRGRSAEKREIEKNTLLFRARREGLPRGRSMGCTFVNPPNISAGKLIDECGLKGCKMGGARVSEIHANFIINEGGSASDIAQLIEYIKQTVYRRTGVLLREEIRKLGHT